MIGNTYSSVIIMFGSKTTLCIRIRRDRFQDFGKVLLLSMKLNNPQRTLDIAWGLHSNILKCLQHFKDFIASMSFFSVKISSNGPLLPSMLVSKWISLSLALTNLSELYLYIWHYLTEC